MWPVRAVISVRLVLPFPGLLRVLLSMDAGEKAAP
jgi:hypothetical protein